MVALELRNIHKSFGKTEKIAPNKIPTIPIILIIKFPELLFAISFISLKADAKVSIV